MNKQQTTWLAWTMWVLVIVLAGVSFTLRRWNYTALLASGEYTALQALMEWVYWDLLIPAAVPAYATVGALIAARQQRNNVGWLCLIFGLLVALQDMAWQYAARATVIAPGSLPAAMWFDWFATTTFALVLLLPLTLILLQFPTGRPPSPRWRRVAWIAVGVNVLAVVSAMLRQGLNFHEVNPTAVPNLTGPADAINTIAMLASLVVLLLAVVSLVWRWRLANGTERQQLKWLAYVAAIAALVAAVALTHGMTQGASVLNVLVGAVALGSFTIGVPVAIGIAILRYRLFDIDVLINRTLVYGTLTAVLALLYIASIVSVGVLLRPLVGANSDLAVVVSTLAIAAVFSPLRRRVQWVIDRRFYRRKYDAQQTLQAFSTNMRDETDVGQLTMELVHVVDRTLQPAHVSLWLREPQNKERGYL